MIRMDLENFDVNIFKKFDKDWALLTAGDYDSRNTMTVSWGFMGTVWNKPCVIVFVRPQRHTFKQMEISDRFTLSFMDESYKDKMAFMGRNSGADMNKYEASGLIPVYDNDSFVSYIKGASYVLKLKTIYKDVIKPENFKDQGLLENYNLEAKDFHTFYIAEVTSLLVDENEK